MALGLKIGLSSQQSAAGYNPAALFAAVTATPAFIYGTVRLREAYSGPAIRVLRPSDSAEVDIGFTGYRLNETALFAHLGVQTGQITRWYDQSGAGNHTDVQTDGTRRATIGPDYRQGGNLVTNHSNTLYTLPAGLSFDRRNSSFYTASGGRNGPGGQLGIWRVGSAGDPYFLAQNGRALQTAGSNLFYPLSRMVSEFHLSATGAVRAFNDMLDTNSALSIGTETGGTIGTADSSFFLNNDHDIFVGYTSALSTGDRAAIKTALSGAFGGIITAGPRVSFVGDSITAGTGDPRGFGYAARASRVLGANCYGAAEGGQQLVNFVANYATGLPRALFTAYPGTQRIAFLHMGTNDLTVGGRTAAQIYADIQSYAGLVRADGAQIIVSTILPNNAWNGTQQTTRNNLNTLIRDNWASFADGLCDFAADPVMGPQAAAANTNLYGDGLHPAPQGHQNLSVLAAAALTVLLTPVAPVITGVPTISGTTTEGQVLTASAASVTGNPAPTRTWQWRRNGVDIGGATSSTYLLVTADVGTVISVRQIETNTAGSTTATSAGTAAIAAGAVFTPADVFTTGIDGFWSPRITFADLWQDTARTTQVTAVGQPVGSWRVNLASGVTYLEQGTAGARPVVRANGSGALYLEFDGTDDALDSVNFATPTGNQESTMMAAVDIDGAFADNVGIITYAPTLAGGGLHRILTMSATGQVKADTAFPGNSALGPIMPTTFCVPEARFETQLSAALNGGAFTTITPTNATNMPANRPHRIGRGVTGTTTAMKIYGVMHVVKTITAGERASLVAWLSALENP